MSQLKSLAGQTAIYGVSSILGRLINYALVPLHTAVFLRDQLGIVTALYAYTAIFMIVYTFGMETAYFRFAKENKSNAYNSCSTVVIIISTLLSCILIIFSHEFANVIGYPNVGKYIKYLAIILWIDSVVAIPFAKLRYENKAKKFASIKIANIFLNIGIQIALLILWPYFNTDDLQKSASIEYIFMANLIANGLLFIFLIKELSDIRPKIQKDYLGQLLRYSAPIFIMGFAGMLSEQLDKILIEHLLPDNYYQNMDGTSATGVYGQTFKLGIFMMLAIQAFRYAGEPFFFSQSDKKDAPELFARVMHYFIIAGLILFVLVSINIDLIAFIFLRSPEYRVALYLVPIILLGKLMYGIYLNLSIWFKLTDKTIYGTYFSVIGMLITVISHLLLIPTLGMLGAALTTFICYFILCIICYVYGQRNFFIPYNFKILTPYFIISITLILISNLLHYQNFVIDCLLRIGVSLILLLLIWTIEKRKILTKTI